MEEPWALPLRIVRPEIVTVRFGGMLKIRNWVAAMALRSTVTRFAPGPMIEISVLIVS
jgi:hypothetical protein